ncbi:uncharacterized protein LOC100823289 [Brachypodium distachyon]|uniref:Uncharacterized protein n=1 Tax=Brachypodium distachyon TaxID=15368 RepID=C3SA51_BRADI|nr:uncharacterized protein LOC100823289 [Brachypodium distachyon]ACF22685.1 hypothetical protein-2 [Brachypodium distachyon]KQJ86613.1 hypothetical protein BRADI_4g06680v3 [Brachypodium distachyon]|eukprot:XP_010237231.1 uncharacterized protein LOC100823289 [Brachypodium distachyon]
MGSASRIMRAALHAFFTHYHPAASSAALLALPFSAAALLSRSPPPSLLLLPALSRRLRRVLVAAGFPPASQLLFLLNHKLSQSAFSFLATLPFSLSFLLLSKSCAVRALQPAKHHQNQRTSSYPAMARTQLANYAALLLANLAVFAALLAAFNAAEALGLGGGGAGEGRAALALSAAGVIVYSVALANAAAVCNLATVVAAAEPGRDRGGCGAVLRAALLLLARGGGADAATAVAVALPASLATAAVEGLFQLRVMRLYMADGRITSAMVCEGLLIAYIHSMICVLDTVVTFIVYQTCKATHSCHLLDLEEKGDFIA